MPSDGEEPAPKPDSGPSQEQLELLFSILLLFLLFIKFWAEAYFEKVNPSFGHNTGVVVCLGILMSWAIFFIASKKGE